LHNLDMNAEGLRASHLRICFRKNSSSWSSCFQLSGRANISKERG